MWLWFWSLARRGRDADTGGQGAVCTPEISLLLLCQDDGPVAIPLPCFSEPARWGLCSKHK